MRIRNIGVAVIGILSLIPGTDSFSQGRVKWSGSGGWGRGSQYNRMYDTTTVETVSGEVVSVERITPMRVMCYGLHLVVKTEKETLSVHLGPGWFIENQEIKIDAKDKVEIKGSRIIYEEKPALIAAEVKKGDEILKLRDESGFPVWAGWRRR